MIITGLAVMTAPLWIPIYMIGVATTTTIYVVVPVAIVTFIASA